MARDGEFDWIRCGSRNRGTVLIDALDFQRGCGRVSRSGAARGVLVYGELHKRKYDLGLACPADMPRACEGTYRLVFSRRRTRSQQWSLQPRQAADSYYFETKLSPAEQRALSRAPASSIELRLVSRNARGRRVTTHHPFPGPPITGWPGYAAGVDCDACPPDPAPPATAG